MKNKSFYKLCVAIINNYQNGIYDNIIEKNYPEYKLNKYQICTLENIFEKKIIEEVWDAVYFK